MKKKVTKGKQSHYEIVLHIDTTDQNKAQQRVITHFQKDLQLPGFRKGFVPMNMVMEHIRPEYIQIGMLEQLINAGLQEVLKENPDVRFIGEPYDIKRDEKGEELQIAMFLDVYPEVEISGKDRTKKGMKAVDTKVTNDEIEQALTQLKKSYADYKEADTIQEDGVAKISLTYHDDKGDTIDTTNTYIGEQEFSASPFYKKNFVGKKKGELVEIAYGAKDLPESFKYTKSDAKPKKIVCEIKDVKQVVLPTFDEETLKKLFPDESTVKSEKDLKEYIKKSLEERKFQEGLLQHVDEYLNSLKGDLAVNIPKTMIEQEFQSRMKNLHQRMGGEERAKQYLEGMGEDKAKAFTDDIKKAALESLEKFFILQKVTELLDLDIDRSSQKDLEVEKKLYDVLVNGVSVPKKEKKVEVSKEKVVETKKTVSTTKATTTKKSTTPTKKTAEKKTVEKKAPAKKTTKK